MSDIKAVTVLRDERITEISRSHRNANGTLIMDLSFARAVEREVLAYAGAPAGGMTAEQFEEIAQSWDGYRYDDAMIDDIGAALRADFKRLAHAGVTAEPAGRGQTDETDISARLRQRAAGAMANQDDAKLMLTAADECNRFYNGMMNWKANAQAKDRTIIELRETSKAAQVPAAEVRAQAIPHALASAQARLLRAAKVYSFNYMQDEAEDEEDCVCGPKQHAEAKEVFAAIREVEHFIALAQQSTADKASEVRAAEWISVEDRLPEPETDVLIIRLGQIRVGAIFIEHESWEEGGREIHYWDDSNDDGQGWDWCEVTHWMKLPEAPSTADSANTGALGEKGADHA